MERQEPRALLESAWERIQAQKKRIDEEIRNYPRPIAACDLQFNYLLEERARTAGELNRVYEAWKKLLAGEPLTSPRSAEPSQPGQQ
jgi:hypothetical protein